jgi:NDP-sugar pyrophosphorylase family protein
MLPVAILAGGLATRLHPITHKIPKALLKVRGRPFILHQLDYLNSQGVDNVVLCLGYLGEMIQELIGDGLHLNINVSYSFDGPKLLGTGGAIKNALPLLTQNFFILYGDTFLPINFKEVERAFNDSNKSALMTVIKNNNKWDKSNVIFKNNKLSEYNKISSSNEMNFIDYGLSVVSSSIFDIYSANSFFDLSDVYNKLSLQGGLSGHEVYKRFYEIGSYSGLNEIEDFL